MPATLEPPPARTQRVKPGPSLAWRLLVSAVRLTAVLILSAILGSAWYIAHKGFGHEWRQRVVEELHKRGVEASVAHLTLDPFRGLVAQDVRIFDYKQRENTIALISEVALEINYGALLQHKPFLNAVDVRNAQLRLPLAGAKRSSGPAQLTKFRAHIYFPPQQIYVAQADGIFCGVRVSASGQLIKRDDTPPSKPTSEEDWQKRLVLLEKTMVELQKFKFSSAPSFQIEFRGDLANLENAVVDVNLRANKAKRGEYEFQNLKASVEFRDQVLTITEARWNDQAGAFAANGSWSRQTNEARFEARSNIDLKGLLGAFDSAGALSDFAFEHPPMVTISGSTTFGESAPKVRVTGNISAPNLTYRSIPASQFNANFSWDGERLFVRDVRLQSQGGQLAAEMLNAPGDFRLNIDSTINPIALRPFVSSEIQQFLGEWEFPRPPSVHLAIRGEDEKPQTWRGDGTVMLDRARFRGIWMNSASAKIHFGDGAVSYKDLRVARSEGSGSGDFTYDFSRHEVRIENLRTTLWPNDIVYWIDPTLLKVVNPYKFRQPPAVTTRGVYQFGGGKNTRLEIAIDSKSGVNYVFIGKTLPFEHVSANLIFTDDRLQINDLAGALFSGQVRGHADISLARNDGRYRAGIIADRIDFPRLTDLYYDYKTSRGLLSGSYDFTGVGSDARKMRGTGKLEVTNGDVFAIPVFGPLSGLMNAVLPGSMGYSIARKATSSFNIKESVIHTDDFEVAGKLFSMLGHGDLYFLDDKLDFTVRMSANGPAALLTPMYKLFEYTGEGSLKHPDWHPKRF